MHCSRIVFSGHALRLRRMFQRGLREDDVVGVLNAGERIAEYPDDRPYPSSLMLGFLGARPVHVVVASDPDGEACYVVTAYVPDSSVWSDDFRTRRAP